MSKKFEQWKKFKSNSDYQKNSHVEMSEGDKQETKDKIEGFNLNQES